MVSEEGREILIQFGSHLRKLRLAKKLSYRKMAVLCNVDSSNIKKIEDGKLNSTVITIHELAKALEIGPEDLFKYHKGLHQA